jgi:hypothetical protein
MDNAPTAGSVNPVKSGGIKTAIDNMAPVDEVTLNNKHSVTSNAVAQRLNVSAGVIELVDTTMLMDGSLFKQDKLVTMSLRIWKEEQLTLNAGQALAMLPQGFRPKANSVIWCNLTNFDSTNTHALIAIDWYGSIYTVITQTVSRLDFYITASWFTD